MRFQKFGDRIVPCGPEANEWYANAKDGDSINLQPEKRTTQQNNATWLFCDMLATALNDAGYDQRTYPFSEGISIPFTKNSVMEIFWRPVMHSMIGEGSTRDMKTKDVSLIYEAINRAMSERVGVNVEFPSSD